MIKLRYDETRKRIHFGLLVIKPRRGQTVRFCRVYSDQSYGELDDWCRRHARCLPIASMIHLAKGTLPQVICLPHLFHLCQNGLDQPVVGHAEYLADLAAWLAGGKPTTALDLAGAADVSGRACAETGHLSTCGRL